MTWLRALAGVLVGYVTAALANMGWVFAWHLPDRGVSIWVLAPLTVVMFAVTGLVAGRLAAAATGDRRILAGYVAAGLVVLAGIVNLSLGAAAEPAWHTLFSIVVQAPALLLGARSGGGSPRHS